MGVPAVLLATAGVAHGIALALAGLGTAVVISSVLGALVAGDDELTKVHFLSPVSSLGIPLVGAGVCVAEGWGITDGEIILIVALYFFTGPAMGAATGRLIAQQDGMLPAQGPE